jgi:hypothetical protein
MHTKPYVHIFKNMRQENVFVGYVMVRYEHCYTIMKCLWN